MVAYIWRQSVGAANFDNKISGNFLWFTTVLWTLKEGKQDTSHIFLAHKRASEIGNLMRLSINYLKVF